MMWVTPIEDFEGDPELVDNGYSPCYFHCFLPAASKTDRFKIGRRSNEPCLSIIKFGDCNALGIWDLEEDGLKSDGRVLN